MPTVDDLTVSLNIKDNSNLDKLRKNLDALLKTGIIGAGGAGVARGLASGMQKNFNDILKDLDYLKTYVTPTQTGGTLTKLASESLSLVRKLEDFNMEGTITSMLEGKKGSLDAIVKAYELEGVEEVRPFLKTVYEDIKQDLMEVAKEEKTLPEAIRMVNLVKELFQHTHPTLGLGRTLLTKYMKLRKEEQKRLAKFLTKVMGDDKFFVEQLKLSRLKESVWGEKNEKIVQALEDELAKDPTLRKEIADLVPKLPGLKDLHKIFKEFGKDEFTEELFTLEGIKSDPKLKALAFRWLELLIKEGWDPEKVTGAMGGYITFLNETFQKEFGENLFSFQKRLDFLLLDRLDKVIELLGFKPSTTGTLFPLESKGGGAGELYKEKFFYAPIAQEAINVLTTRINASFTKSDKITVAILKRQEMLEAINEKHEYNVEQIQKLQEEVQKKVKEETTLESVKEMCKAIKKVVEEEAQKSEEEGITTKTMKELIEEFSKLMDAAGIPF